MKSKKTSILLVVIMLATMFSVAVPIGGSSTVEVDANGPYGTLENPYCAPVTVVFEADIIGGNIGDYMFRWDINNDGFFEGPGSAGSYFGAKGENTLVMTIIEPYIGQARVEAWDGVSIIGGKPDTITDTADVWIVYCPYKMLEDLKDLINFFDYGDFSKPNAQNTFNNKIDAILEYLDLADLNSICKAIDKLINDILPKTDGKKPPKDWVEDPFTQQAIENEINKIIEALRERADALGGCNG